MKDKEIYTRNSIFLDLNEYCLLSKEGDFMEITEWKNEEGYDVTINERNFHLTYGQFKALKKGIKLLSKHVDNLTI